MNFFKLFIGDYQRDTAHLTLVENGVYMMMLQHYYATEKPIPKGKALHRMLRAQDKSEREAIDAVAARFWIDTPDGLINERALKEIEKAAIQAETNARIAQEREAKRKVAREQHEPSTNRDTNRRTKTAPRARDHSHSHSHSHKDQDQKQVNDDVLSKKPAVVDPPTKPPNGADAITTRALELAILLRKGGAALTGSDPNVRKWATAGISDAQALTALETAQQNRAATCSSQPINSGYLDSILSANDTKPAEPKRGKGPPWWTSNELMEAKAKELKISPPKPGESWEQFRGRINAKLAEREGGQAAA
jgi:uncharacterized protein YdaU (DUF1376 family)